VLRNIGSERVMLIGDAAGMVSPITGGGIHTALHFGRRAAILVCDYLGSRGIHPVAAISREAPRYGAKLLLRRALDMAPPNVLINAMFMTGPMRALAQRLYFHARCETEESFAAWSQRREMEKPSLRLLPSEM
jgi:flavin-dependent dehydrogenase